MRLDKFVAQALNVTRSQAKKLIARKRIEVNQQVCSDIGFKVETCDNVKFDEKNLCLVGKRYIILHKPGGFICSRKDENYPSALKLLGNVSLKELHFAGRLDADTTGLVLISDDGQWTHRVTSPRSRCNKRYHVKVAFDVDSEQLRQLAEGIVLKDDPKPTKAAHIDRLNSREIFLTISEGRYHQVKRMLAAVGNHVEQLHREKIGAISLNGLKQGEWRNLTQTEVELF